MTNNTKILIVAIALVVVTVFATIGITGWLREPEVSKKDYNDAVDEITRLEQTIISYNDSVETVIRNKEIEFNKKLDSILNEKKNLKIEYDAKINTLEALYNIALTDRQLDSLRATFRNKTGG